MSPPDQEPDWLDGEQTRAKELAATGQKVNNPSADKSTKRRKTVKADRPQRTLKGFRIRSDYQQYFDELVAREKHASGKKGPDLVEEALELLFKRYDKTLTN